MLSCDLSIFPIDAPINWEPRFARIFMMEKKKEGVNTVDTFLVGMLFRMLLVSHIPSCNILQRIRQRKACWKGGGSKHFMPIERVGRTNRRSGSDNRYHLPSWRLLASSGYNVFVNDKRLSVKVHHVEQRDQRSCGEIRAEWRFTIGLFFLAALVTQWNGMGQAKTA